ncbi:peptidyl-prolyl cis-trans isomerase [Gracilinema caldarium]|uniref:PpiC-type peptidyl-prolyl cis-trans isomerase n=1 Tax=Gracilinema caldarium (strain ATCC 51460 / DSM 7334 / H1) TaxID=744872 RepID=F8F1M0_GRAC1|nr:peptidyl-prolyl cis-trans isomerase [Gracilinema caldarium]AEJ19073.1 PpiC-type peptidyl-prolyl cis-trans isomerase [Gracilinema caldarium DSM 7334]
MKRNLLLTLFVCAVTVLIHAQTDLQPVALVKLTKTEPITVKQLKAEVQKIESQTGKSLTVDERKQVLDIMINERLALQAAERDKISVTDAEINQQLQQVRSTMAQNIGRQPTDTEFETAIKQQTGMDLASYKEQMKRLATVQKYLMTKKQDIIQSIQKPTESEIKNFYELNKAKLVRPDTVRFSMIFIPYGSDATAKAKAKELAEKLIKDIGTNPSKFDEAVLRGQSSTAGYQAGDGGYLPKTPEAQNIVGKEFINIAFSLKQGEVSRLIENTKGYQIIKITETYSQKTLELDDIYQLGSKVSVHDYIGNVLYQQTQQAAFDRASKELVDELRAGGKSFQVFDKLIAY